MGEEIRNRKLLLIRGQKGVCEVLARVVKRKGEIQSQICILIINRERKLHKLTDLFPLTALQSKLLIDVKDREFKMWPKFYLKKPRQHQIKSPLLRKKQANN